MPTSARARRAHQRTVANSRVRFPTAPAALPGSAPRSGAWTGSPNDSASATDGGYSFSIMIVVPPGAPPRGNQPPATEAMDTTAEKTSLSCCRPVTSTLRLPFRSSGSEADSIQQVVSNSA